MKKDKKYTVTVDLKIDNGEWIRLLSWQRFEDKEEAIKWATELSKHNDCVTSICDEYPHMRIRGTAYKGQYKKDNGTLMWDEWTKEFYHKQEPSGCAKSWGSTQEVKE